MSMSAEECRMFIQFFLFVYRDRGAKSQWRRSFGSSPVASKEDVAGSPCTNQSDWQSNYNYLMDCDLIECCRSLHGELSWDPGDLEFGATSAVKLRSQQKELCPAPLGVSIAPPCPVDVVEMTNTPGFFFFLFRFNLRKKNVCKFYNLRFKLFLCNQIFRAN